MEQKLQQMLNNGLKNILGGTLKEIKVGSILRDVLPIIPTHENLGKFIIVVGGGPVGLWTACLTRMLSQNYDINIVIFEKRTEYIREHLLLLKSESYLVPEITETHPQYKNYQNLVK